MKNVLLAVMLLCASVVQAQSVTRTKTVENLNFGLHKLQYIVEAGDTSYIMSLADVSTQRSDRVVIALGTKSNALRLLRFMVDLKLDKDDVAMLENETNNFIMRDGMGGMAVFHELGYRYGRINKYVIKRFIKALEIEKDE